MGLVISDSFKAVVTIYILIPFLVIPQIILSGVMVRFEKLNPNIPFQSPVTVPFYGEAIVARWGYEALAVEQFMNNRYEKQFYVYDQTMSKANFIKQYWKEKVDDRLTSIDNSLAGGKRDEVFLQDLEFLNYEINKQLKNKPDTSYRYSEFLTPEKVTPAVIQATKNYVEKTRRYYMDRYNEAYNLKDRIIVGEMSKDKEGFTNFKNKYFNEKLDEFVTNKTETDKSLVFRNRLYQKMNPIYMDPEYKFIKAHFYSPKKMVFGLSVDTFVVNVIVLWMMTILLYLVLYFRLLKKLLDSGEQIMDNSKKGSD
jgi:hypothetical protein